MSFVPRQLKIWIKKLGLKKNPTPSFKSEQINSLSYKQNSEEMMKYFGSFSRPTQQAAHFSL